jgi:sulfite dehydrogenase
MKRTILAGVLCGVLCVGVGLFAAEITLPPESARLSDSSLPGYALANTYCFTCHSVDYIQYQPPANSRATWRASVVKMQKVFGAPIPDRAIDPIAEYLARTYGAERVADNAEPAPSSRKRSRR